MFEEEEKETPCLTPLPKEFNSLANKNLPYSALPALRYLKDRGITKKDIIYWKIGYCSEGEYKNRIVVPSFNLDGHANFFVARTYTDGWPKYMSPQTRRSNLVFNKLFLDFQSDMTITEGVFDAIVAGPNAVPILGSNLKENSTLFQEIIKNDTPVYIALDIDAEKKAMKLIENFLKYDIELYKINIAPYNDLGEMNKEEFLRRKKEASFLTSENYLSYKIASLF
jgi:DNA primase